MAKEDEKDKEEKVEIELDQNRIRSEKLCDTPGGPYYRMKMPIAYLAELSQLPEVRAEVARQDEAKRIGPGDWVIKPKSTTIFMVTGMDYEYYESLHDIEGYTARTLKSECRKITDPTLIAALNAEIEGKAGG